MESGMAAISTGLCGSVGGQREGEYQWSVNSAWIAAGFWLLQRGLCFQNKFAECFSSAAGDVSVLRDIINNTQTTSQKLRASG